MQTIEATYYDTRNLRLTRASVAVRRSAAEWVATLPTGDVRFPDAADVPAELRALLVAYTGGRELEPCARVTIERDRWHLADNGTVLADVLSDQLTARPLGDRTARLRSWQETEVEPRGETPAARRQVAKRLARSGWPTARQRNPLTTLTGVRPSTVELGKKPSIGQVLGRYLSDQVAALRVADVALRRGAPEGVHDLRVAVRRIRTCLRVFARYFRPKPLARLRTELEWLFGVLGEARDVEVLRARITDALHALPDELVLGPVSVELDRYLAKREARTMNAVRDAMTGARYLGLLNLLDDIPRRPAAQKSAKKALPKRIRKSFRKLRASVEDASRARERDVALHAVRKKAKRLRYACEIAEPVLGKPAKRMRRGSKEIQRVLGDHHDSVEMRATLRELGSRAQLDGSNGFTFGLLHGQASERARHQETEFGAAWRALEDQAAR
ncbi:MAG TPA: CHAD domain-containing protein [Pseudonocardiaceae bacterium]